MDDPLHVPWPKRPDGSNMTMGEMTPEQRRAQWKAAVLRVKAKCERPGTPTEAA